MLAYIKNLSKLILLLKPIDEKIKRSKLEDQFHSVNKGILLISRMLRICVRHLEIGMKAMTKEFNIST